MTGLEKKFLLILIVKRDLLKIKTKKKQKKQKKTKKQRVINDRVSIMKGLFQSGN